MFIDVKDFILILLSRLFKSEDDLYNKIDRKDEKLLINNFSFPEKFQFCIIY